jgi:hypothetical protein
MRMAISEEGKNAALSLATSIMKARKSDLRLAVKNFVVNPSNRNLSEVYEKSVSYQEAAISRAGIAGMETE